MCLFICSALLEAYNGLSQLPSDNALKHFLSVLHDNYDKVNVYTCHGVPLILLSHSYKLLMINWMAMLVKVSYY